MNPDPDVLRLLRAEQAAEAARALAHGREAGRSRGVAWSGLAPDPLAARLPGTLSHDAAQRLAALRRWRRSRPGRLLAAVAEAERALEVVRACVARGLMGQDPRCAQAIAALRRAAAAAGAEMDAAPPGALSDDACATNIGSSSRSTASSTSSAS